jgi:predicted amidohydrolase YtcJ
VPGIRNPATATTLAIRAGAVHEVAGRTRADLMFDYLQVWRKAGVPAADTLRAFTIEPARLIHADGERGRIAVGLAADPVAMPADPLADTENLRRIDFVMKDRRVIRGPALALAH